MRCISQVMPFSLVAMSARGKGANNTDVWVVHQPAGERHRAVLQITIRPGKHRSSEEHLAFQLLLAAIMRLRSAAAKSHAGHLR
jgi:hypothetical protein